MSVFRRFLKTAAFGGLMVLATLGLNACSGENASGNDGQDESGKSHDSSGYDSFDSNRCPVVTSRDQFLNPDVNYDEFVDPRDGRSYKTVKIGKQTWFAQNLNYASDQSLCIDTLGNNCEIYGRKYVGDYCPKGWHLPSMSEWSELLGAAGRNDEIEAVMLKSRFGWKDSERGIDVLGFSMGPFSSANCDQTSFLIGGKYSNNDYSVNCVTFGRLVHGYYTDNASYVTGCSVGYFYSVSEGLPVRCVKDEENEVPGPTVDTENLEFWNNETKEDFLNPSIEYGEMTDERDGKNTKRSKLENKPGWPRIWIMSIRLIPLWRKKVLACIYSIGMILVLIGFGLAICLDTCTPMVRRWILRLFLAMTEKVAVY